MVSTTRSARDTLSKKPVATTPIAAGSRKSERLEKKTPPSIAAAKVNSSAVKTKKKNEKTTTSAVAVAATPLRRSERMNKSLSSPASSSTSPSTPSKCSNSKKRKCVKEASEDEEEEEDEEERDVARSSKVNKKRLNARVYRADFTNPGDCDKASNKMDNSTQECGNSAGGETPKDGILPSEDAKAKEATAGSRLSESVKELLEDNRTNDTNNEASEATERNQSDCCGEETSQMLELSNSMRTESGLNGHVKELSKDNATLGLSVPSIDTNNKASESPERNQSDCHGEETSQMLESRNLMRAESALNGSALNGPVKELSVNNAALGSLAPSNATDNETSGALECDQSDCCRDEKSQMLLSRSSILNENLNKNCVGNDNGENLISCKRKGTVMDMHSDVSTTLVDDENCNLIADTESSRLCGNNVGTNGTCSKRIRQISLSDVQSDKRELINHVDQLSSKSDGVKSSTENKEERPQGNDVEYIRKQQRSLHLSLKPEIAKLCEILLLPDNVKNMVDSCLDYVMNNRQICIEPVTILQAFQLSLCWIAASLLKHKLDFEASIKLAKRHMNFNCKKGVVDEIYSRLWELKGEILFHAGNPVVTDTPKASKSANKVYSCTEVAPEVELANKDISKSTTEIHKCENQLGKVLLKQQGERQKLKADIEKENADFKRRCQIEWAAIQHSSPNDAMKTERLKFFSNEYGRRLGELKRQHEIRLKDLKAMQVETMRKFGDSRERGEGKRFDNIVEATTRAGTGVGLSKSPDTNSPVVVLCSSLAQLQTPLVKHAGAKEMDIMASKDGPVSRNKCHSIDENKYGSQRNIIPKHSSSREQCSGGAANTADEGEGCKNFSCESHNDCEQDTAALVLLSSNRGISDRGTTDVPNGEAALAMSKTSNSNDDQEVPSSRKGKLNQTILGKPHCGFSVEVGEGVRDGVENKASSSSQLSVEHIPNSENAAQIHEADNCSDSNNGETPKLPPSDERTCGGAINLSGLDRELSRPCGTAGPSDGPDANATAILNQDPLEKQNPDEVSSSIPAEQIAVEVPESSHEVAPVNVSDRESPAGMSSTVSCPDYPENVTPLNSSSMDQVSDGGSVLDGNLSSRSCEASSLSSGLAIAPLNPPSLEQPDRVSVSLPNGQILVIAPETSHEVAECQLTDTLMVDKSTTSDQQEGVQRTMTENTLNHEAPVSRPIDSTEPAEQVQPLSPVQSPADPDTAREIQNTLVSGPVDIVPANQSNHVSLVVGPPVQVQQLTCAEFLSSNQDLSSIPSATGVEHQRINGDTLSSHVPEASTEVPNHAVEQHASNLELDSQSHQVVHPASNLYLDSPMLGVVRTESSDPRNLSTTSDINNHPNQTATQSASRIAPPLCHDPLKNELERIRKLAEQNMKNLEDTKLQLKSDFEKERDELLRKYEVKFHDTEVEFQQQRKELDTQFRTVIFNKALAEAFRYKCLDHKASGTSGMHQDPSFAQQLFQLITQQISTWPPPVAGSSSCGPPAASLQSPYTTSNSQTVAPPPPGPPAASLQSPYATRSSQTVVPPPPWSPAASLQSPYTTSSSQTLASPLPRPTYNSSGIFSSVSARLPHTNSISSPSVNFQTGGGLRSPAPHLQPCRPLMSEPASTSSAVPHFQPSMHSMSVPASPNLCTVPPGTPSQPASSNITLNPPSFPHQLPSLLSRPNQSELHKGPRPVSAGGLPTPNLSATDLRVDANSQSGINLPNILPRLSDLASLNLPRVGTSSSRPANSPLQATSSDVVCLSDDE